MRIFRTSALTVFLAFSTVAFAQTAAKPAAGINDVLSYISSGWTTLRRSPSDCATFIDRRQSQQKAMLYFPADEPMPAAAADIAKRCNLDVKPLPQVITGPGQFHDDANIKPGVLYLPHPYVVPGGFFNEMYGWDSYFIVRGLLQAKQIDLARGQVENFFYEIKHYGSVLNANRTYFLTRSQPPFLSEMVIAVYQAEKQQQNKDDKEWLAEAYPYIARDWLMWTSAPHLAGDTGLSRYYDFGDGPTPDIAATGNPYYAEMISSVLSNGEQTDYLADSQISKSTIGPAYKFQLCIAGTNDAKSCAKASSLRLTADYYKGDRSMRESGFDVSSRFGPYSGHTHHFAPVCLNSLLYQTEKNMEQIAAMLGRNADAKQWAERAKIRAQRMNQYLWNAEKGMFFDYDFMAGKQSDYAYATAFYPLWVGMASGQQAQALGANVKLFEQPGGLVMSTNDSKLQWDYPYGWAPINLIDIEGLRKYGERQEADRLSYKFLSMIVDNFRRDGTIREKYNVVTRSDEQDVAVGYHVNVIGFGWTNGAFLSLLHELPQPLREDLDSGKSWVAAVPAAAGK